MLVKLWVREYQYISDDEMNPYMQQLAADELAEIADGMEGRDPIFTDDLDDEDYEG